MIDDTRNAVSCSGHEGGSVFASVLTERSSRGSPALSQRRSAEDEGKRCEKADVTFDFVFASRDLGKGLSAAASEIVDPESRFDVVD